MDGDSDVVREMNGRIRRRRTNTGSTGAPAGAVAPVNPWRRGVWRLTTTVTLTAIAALLTALSARQALAAPADPTDGDIASAQSAQDAAAAEVGRVAALVATAESELQRVSVLAEAANGAYRVAAGELDEAQQAGAAAAEALRVANDAVVLAQGDVADLGRESHMQGGSITGVAALLSAEGPSDLLQQASTLRLLGEQRAAVLEQLRVAQVEQADADSRARAAVADKDAAAAQAAWTRAAADEQVRTFTATVQTVTAQKAGYERQLRDAQVHVLALKGQRDAYRAWEDQRTRRAAAEQAQAAAAAEATARVAARARQAAADPGNGPRADIAPVRTPVPVSTAGGVGVAPTSGRFTTCYEMRWGIMHSGVDIAAPIGTPIYAPAAGRVVKAGAASGYGLAVSIQHDDGAVTVYGHINDYSVSVGQRVSAGEVVAEVGNRGHSTGPHLHFQVNTKGLHAGPVNPIPWLAEQGVSMGGRCQSEWEIEHAGNMRLR